MGSKFRGLGVAMVTPFNEDGTVDYISLTKLTNHLIDGDVDYLVVMGTTGENPTIYKNEQLDILHKVQEVNDGRLPIVFGIGGNNTQSIVEQINSMDFNGIDGILSVSPYYSKPNQEGIYQHYKKISEVSPVPVIIYNVPGRTGSTISPETTLRIADLPNMHATKEASGSFDIVMNILKNKKDDFHVFSGDDDLTLPFISVGMEGVISVIGNAYPSLFSRMVHLALDGKFEEAREIHYQLLPMIKAIFMDGNPPGVKYLLSKMGICKNVFRLPVHPVNQHTEKAIDKAFI